MYKISVPLNSDKTASECDAVLKQLKRAGVDRVFLSIGQYKTDGEERKKTFKTLKENCEFFKKHGFETGVWMWAFYSDAPTGFEHITGANGGVNKQFNCPSDEKFIAFMQNYVEEAARCGVEIIMFDDDFRFGHYNGDLNCTCKNHMKMVCELVGEDITPREFKEKSLSGGENKYRNAWFKANGESLLRFARAAREAVNRVNPNIRLGACSCMSNWGNDGVHPEEYIRAFAGDTKPFVRLIGAPYWAVNRMYNNSRLQNIVEFERMQASRLSDDIEILAEGDVWPRPRYNCPASYLELFDTALRADGGTSGIHKYMFDYCSGVDYETGYVDMHVKNSDAYEWIEKHFSGKECVGVKVYNSNDTLKTMLLPSDAKKDAEIDNAVFSPAAVMLSDCGIPTVYKEDGICGAAFGENVNLVSENAMKNGLVIDLRAAEILRDKGIDTGLISRGERVYTDFCNEYFEEYKQNVLLTNTDKLYKTTLKPGCKVLSSITSDEKVTVSYLYENEQGYRFLVFAFEGYFNHSEMSRTYARSRQIADAVKWLSGKKLPAYAEKNPDFYVLVKRNENAVTVGMWNMFADPVFKPVLELDGKAYKITGSLNCTAEICGGRAVVSEIQPFSFAAFEMEEYI